MGDYHDIVQIRKSDIIDDNRYETTLRIPASDPGVRKRQVIEHVHV